MCARREHCAERDRKHRDSLHQPTPPRYSCKITEAATLVGDALAERNLLTAGPQSCKVRHPFGLPLSIVVGFQSRVQSRLFCIRSVPARAESLKRNGNRRPRGALTEQSWPKKKQSSST